MHIQDLKASFEKGDGVWKKKNGEGKISEEILEV